MLVGARYRSTMHRVHPPLGTDCYSIAHFATPDYETVVRAPPGTVTATRPPVPIHAGRNFTSSSRA